MIPGVLTNLRAVDRSDLDCIHTWLDDPELMRFWGYGAPAISRATVASRIEEWLAGEQIWDHPVAFIVETLEGSACGLIVLSRMSAIDRSCELSLFLESPARGQGFGSDVIDAIADAAFSQWNVHRLTVQSEAHNTVAHEFFQGNGFQLEGRLRQARFLDGHWHDILIFGRLATDDEDAR